MKESKAQRLTTIRQTVLIDAAPDEVYTAYVDPRKHEEFTGSPATGTPKVGSKFTAWGGYSYGKYIELKKGEKIVHDWTTTDWPEEYQPSVVEITLKERAGKTSLTMVHSKVPAAQAESYAQGWKDYYWEPLKRHFARK